MNPSTISDEQVRAWLRAKLKSTNMHQLSILMGMSRESLTGILAAVSVRAGTMALARQKIHYFQTTKEQSK